MPYNKLHDRFYPSLGCAPCTRSVTPGEDIRAGRWWWEDPANKECGLHASDARKVAHGAGVSGVSSTSLQASRERIIEIVLHADANHIDASQEASAQEI